MKAENSYFTIAGLLFGRGSLINPRQNCIVLYFFDNENEFIKEVKNILKEYEPIERKIKLDSIGVKSTVNGIYILAKNGKIIKDNIRI